jgi:predicted ATPase/class 3 adenylate cyclase/predicted Ser/Thr protein kinase
MKINVDFADLILEEKLHESESSVVYKCKQKNSAENFILKTSNSRDFSHILNEFELYKEFNISSLVHHDLTQSLFRPYYEGVTLKHFISKEKQGLALFFEYAKKIVLALNKIHELSIIHKDITPLNIIVNEDNLDLKIIDFDSGTKLQSVNEAASNGSRFVGHFFYISPEQTGRMNRSLDYRSDYYSMGITFYEMILGKCPFSGQDALELMHCHLAKNAPLLHELNPAIPKYVSYFIDKLINKNPEDRYQSGIGILSDLDHCKMLWENGKEAEFRMGEHDVPVRLYVSQKMVGREKELEMLFQNFSATVHGAKKLVRVSGLSGIGKSTLIRETLKPITANRGHFIQGKFEALNRNIPYSAWKAAIDQLADNLLSETPEILSYRRAEILQAMEGLGAIITRYSQKWEKVIGEQPVLPDLGGVEQQNRFLYAINLFLNALATASHPLLIFIDDWQWADEASIKLLQSIFTEPNVTHLMIVAAYRHNEINETTPFWLACKEIEVESKSLQTHIHLEPLTEKDCGEILQQTFHQDNQDLSELIKLIHDKTLGNAFLIHQFLGWLYDNKALWLNIEDACWQWDVAKIKEVATGDDLVEIVLDRLGLLPQETLTALSAASVLGNTFSLDLLAKFLGESQAQVHQKLWKAITENIITPVSNDYKYLPDYLELQQLELSFQFNHDRLQQALYKRIPKKELLDLHFSCAQFYFEEGISDDSLFAASKHFLIAKEKIANTHYTSICAGVLEKAGIGATRSAAFAIAYEYLDAAFTLIGSNSVPNLVASVAYVESAYLCGKHTEASEKIEQLISQTSNLLDRSSIFEMLIRSHTSIGNFAKATELTQMALFDLRVKIPAKASTGKIIVAALTTRMRFPDKDIDKIGNLPEMTDPHGLQIMRVINAALPAYFLSGSTVYPLLLFHGIQVSKKYGNAPESAAIYISYGIVLSGIFKAKASAYTIGKQSLVLANKMGSGTMLGQVGFTDNMFLMYLKEPIKKALPLALNYHRASLATGNMQYAGWNLFSYNWLQNLLGVEINKQVADGEYAIDFMRRYNLHSHIQKTTLSLEYNKHLLGKTNSELILVNANYDAAFIAEETAKNDEVTLFNYYLHRAVIFYLYNNNVAAIREIANTIKHFKGGISSWSQPFADFMAALIANEAENKYSKAAKKASKILADFKKMQSSNFLWMLDTLEAEKHFYVKGMPEKHLYFEAYHTATKDGFGIPAAIPLILLFKHQVAIQLGAEAASTAMELQQFLTKVNANGLLGFFAKQYATYFSKSVQKVSLGNISTSDVTSFDSLTIIKTTQALTAEIELDKLVNRLLFFAMENAGATEGVFLLPNETNGFEAILRMTAAGDVSKPDNNNIAIPSSILNYAIQTRDTLILEDAISNHPFSDDLFIIANHLRSILCIPFVHQNKIAGIIYMSHHSLANVFTAERVALLRMLAGQVAVSIENARMYATLEKLVEKRTEQLAYEKKKSDELLLNILPEEIADELKIFGKAKPRLYTSASVMFCDIINFTEQAAGMTPENLVAELDNYFQAFDKIVEKHGVEKIKTIGDSYMAAAGIPTEQKDHAKRLSLAAIEIRNFLLTKKQENGLGVNFEMRIGIHSGPLVAGIVGHKKFQYDIWGDTVNTASRMESNGETGKINVSATTYDLLKTEFNFEPRGMISMKGKGEIESWFLVSKK